MAVIFGWGKFAMASLHLAALGRRPLVLTGASTARRLGLVDTLVQGLHRQGCRPIVAEGIPGEPRADLVDQIAVQARQERCDAVIGLGGGSVMDAAKAVAAVARTGASSWDVTIWGRIGAESALPITDPLPVGCIPTVTGTGSEANGVGVLSHPANGQKAVFIDDRLTPQAAIVDPSLAVTVDPVRTWAGAVDLLTHGLEDYLTRESPDPVLGQRCLRLTRRVLRMASRAVNRPQDRVARTALASLAMAVWDGSYNSPETPWTLHAIAHVVGGRLSISHGLVISRLLPAWLAFINDAHPDRLPDSLRAFPPLTLQLPPSSLSTDVDGLAAEVVVIYGSDGVLPGWPEVTQTDVARIVRMALDGDDLVSRYLRSAVGQRRPATPPRAGSNGGA